MNTERYERHALIDWFDQKELLETSVIVVGAGAIGNELIKNLALIGVGNMSIIDFDNVEIHNLTRSVLFSEKDIGCNKAEAATKAVKQINPDCNVTFSKEHFWKSLSISNIKNSAAVFCCVDNFEARLGLNKLCYIARTDFYNSGIDSRYVSVEAFPYSVNPEYCCYECNLPHSVYKRVYERYSCGWLQKIAYKENKIPTTIVTSSIAASQMLSLFLQRSHPDGFNEPIKVFTDTIKWSTSVTTQHKNNECPNCSSISSEVIHIKVKNYYRQFCENNPNDNELTIELSEPVILDVICKQCGDKREINDLASKYNENITICDRCRLHSNNPTIRDCLTLSEINRFFPDKIPVKYLKLNTNNHQFILEMED